MYFQSCLLNPIIFLHFQSKGISLTCWLKVSVASGNLMQLLLQLDISPASVLCPILYVYCVWCQRWRLIFNRKLWADVADKHVLFDASDDYHHPPCIHWPTGHLSPSSPLTSTEDGWHFDKLNMGRQSRHIIFSQFKMLSHVKWHPYMSSGLTSYPMFRPPLNFLIADTHYYLFF